MAAERSSIVRFDFFLSHNKAEKDWARSLAAALRDKGAKVSFDEDSVSYGDDIVAAIEHALRNSRHVILVLSQKSIASRWVELEWASALYSDPDASSRYILPIVVQDCDIPWVLRRLRHIDARDRDVAAVVAKHRWLAFARRGRSTCASDLSVRPRTGNAWRSEPCTSKRA